MSPQNTRAGNSSNSNNSRNKHRNKRPIYTASHRTCMPKIKQFLLFACGIFLFSSPKADEIRLAVAANFVQPMAQLIEKFRQINPHQVTASYGSSGKLYTQIRQGAPFDLFFSADSATALRLVSDGLALADSRTTYAIGQLVLWHPQNRNTTAQNNLAALLNRAQFRHLALAQPKLAPYGLATQQVLEKLGLWQKLQTRLVFGENVSQAYQFVASGNAELGFVPLSSVIGQAPESWSLVPSNLHSPIEQQMVLLSSGTPPKPAVKAFWQFIQTPPAQAIIQAAGYQLPNHLPSKPLP